MSTIKALFTDVGGVLATNGWDRTMRQRAAQVFGLDYAELDGRHHRVFDTFEQGKLTLDVYLNQTVFYQERPFSRERFKEFMFSQTKPWPQMIDLVRGLKKKYGLKVVVVSNEGRELTLYRIQELDLKSFVDIFIYSCFVHVRKPDADIFRLALDVAQVAPEETVYLEDRAMFVEVAASLGIQALQHQDHETTRKALSQLGLSLAE